LDNDIHEYVHIYLDTISFRIWNYKNHYTWGVLNKNNDRLEQTSKGLKATEGKLNKY